MGQQSGMIGKISTFLSPNKVIFGFESARLVGQEAKGIGADKALIVTDEGVMGAGLIMGIEESLASAGLRTRVFDKVEAEPPARIVDECLQVNEEEKYDVIVGVGGGSSLDVAKAISIMSNNKGNIVDYDGTGLVPNRGLPMILIPTTAGTGSEVTRVLVVTDERDNAKKVIFSDYLLADIAIVDPLLTLSAPPKVTAEAGIDALVHAMESYVSALATPFSDLMALEAIRLIGESLPRAYGKGSDVVARNAMSLAATLAGMAFTSAGLGAVHALAYPLGTEFHMSHGRSQAVVLPHVLNYNKIGNLEKYARIARAMGERDENLSLYDRAERLVSHIKRLLGILNISFKISDYGVSREDIPRLVEGALKQSRLFVPNPRDLTEEDVRTTYLSAF